MLSWIPITAEGIYCSCFLLSILSALLPWLNGEVVLLSFAALAPGPWQLIAVILLTTSGQMAGKCILYWMARRGIQPRSARMTRTLTTWKERLAQSPSKSLAIVFISSTLSIPPFYVLTIIFGILKMRFKPFILVGACGRLLHFGALALIPALTFHFFR
jgi:membrane protein YqaA with SNARE-associated domain